MKVFFDSSAFAKRYVDERGSDAVERLCQDTSEVGLSVICPPEIISALNRRRRERTLSPSQYQEAKVRLSAEVADATLVNLVPAVVRDAIRLLETNPLRAMDALHVACALHWHADLLVSADERQLAAAEKSGLPTRRV